MNSKQKIIIIRNDKLGDFMLAWPAIALIKKNLPDCEIHALVNPYTADIAELCPNIDHVILDPGKEAKISEQLAFSKALKQQHFDAAISLFSTTRIGCLLMLAGIPYRLAPATKIAQIFYHKRLKQRRSLSEKPEYAYNQDLALEYLKGFELKNILQPQAPYLKFDIDDIDQIRNDFCKTHQISPALTLIFIHPGSGGSANNLTLEQYAALANNLQSAHGHHIVVSAGPGEIDKANILTTMLANTPHTLYHSTKGLERFAHHIAFADLFISGSTGPLHIAGALNRCTVAFYPRRQSATALRWQTTNDEDKRLAFSPSQNESEEDMSSIDAIAVATQVSKKFLAT